MWAHDMSCRRIAVLVCSRGTLKKFIRPKTALPGKDTALVGELAMVTCLVRPSRRILMPSCWHLFCCSLILNKNPITSCSSLALGNYLFFWPS